MRDLLAQQRQSYKDYVADNDRSYDEAIRKARHQPMITRVLEWGLLFFIIFCAAYMAM